jgi:hypothetical protein
MALTRLGAGPRRLAECTSKRRLLLKATSGSRRFVGYTSGQNEAGQTILELDPPSSACPNASRAGVA